MTPRSVILIVAALLIAAGTAFFVRSWLSAERTQVTAAVPAPEVPTKTVLVAKANLPAGTLIRKEDLRWQAWPDKALDPTYMIQGQHDMNAVTGAVVRRGIVSGQPVTEAMIARPGDRGFLAAVLTPGMRAVSVPINNNTGISGLVLPGDRVDITLTHSISRQAGEAERTVRASETILENVRVLAVGQHLDDQSGEPVSANTVTIEVTPRQVEFMNVAADLGRLSLSLRSLARSELAESGAALAASETETTDITGTAPTSTAMEDAAPERGRTYTRDSEVSRLISNAGGGNHSVTVFYGNASSQVRVEEEDAADAENAGAE